MVFGSSNRKGLADTELTPGPNYYSSDKAKDYRDHSNPKYKIGGEKRKSCLENDQDTPGPGFYQYKSAID